MGKGDDGRDLYRETEGRRGGAERTKLHALIKDGTNLGSKACCLSPVFGVGAVIAALGGGECRTDCPNLSLCQQFVSQGTHPCAAAAPPFTQAYSRPVGAALSN